MTKVILLFFGGPTKNSVSLIMICFIPIGAPQGPVSTHLDADGLKSSLTCFKLK